MSINTITLVGRAGRDPELRFFESGTSVANLTMAVDKASSNREEEPDWFSLEIWGKQAQVAADYVRKGSLIGVVGRMTSEQWTDRNTGERRSKPVVKVDRLALLGSKADSNQARPLEEHSAPQAAAPAGQPRGSQVATAIQPAGSGAAAAAAETTQPALQGWGSAITSEEVPF
jgi:single-strand DNA-binding protein